MLPLTNGQGSKFLLKAVLSLVGIALLSLPSTAQLFHVENLVSDIPNVGSQPTDPDLVNPWGVAASPSSPWWVSDNGTGLSTLYDGNGVKQGLVVSIPQWDGSQGGVPDGIVFNGTQDFQLSQGNPAFFLFATEDGTIQGWNPAVNATTAVIEVNGWPNSVYKGLTIGSANGTNYIYAANFRTGNVDVFDPMFMPHSFGSNAFKDSTIPAGYAPFNVANINGNIIVSYALQDSQKHDDVAGAGHGYLRVFNSQGTLLQRLPHVYQLNSPWAMAVAPSGWGTVSGDLLVGQFGSGAILAFDVARNAFITPLLDESALPIRINGLWGFGFGNGARSGPTNVLYFAAGYFDEAHGLFGTVAPTQSISAHGSSSARARSSK